MNFVWRLITGNENWVSSYNWGFNGRVHSFQALRQCFGWGPRAGSAHYFCDIHWIVHHELIFQVEAVNMDFYCTLITREGETDQNTGACQSVIVCWHSIFWKVFQSHQHNLCLPPAERPIPRTFWSHLINYLKMCCHKIMQNTAFNTFCTSLFRSLSNQIFKHSPSNFFFFCNMNALKVYAVKFPVMFAQFYLGIQYLKNRNLKTWREGCVEGIQQPINGWRVGDILNNPVVQPANKNIPVSILCFLHKLDEVTCLQREVLRITRLVC